MKSSARLLSDIQKMMGNFVGQVFTEDMRQMITVDVLDATYSSYLDGQADIAPDICVHSGTNICSQSYASKQSKIYNTDHCADCILNGTFSIRK